MTATIEAPVEAVDPIHAFQMPKPCMGQPVTWWPAGTRDLPGETAFVIRVGRRNIILRTASGVCMETVRHIDDPKLKLNSDQRESGAWDFTEHDKSQLEHGKRIPALEAQVADLLARIAALEELIAEPAKKGK